MRKYHWLPDRPDKRDAKFRFVRPTDAPVQTSADLRNLATPVFDQAQMGSCTGNAITAVLEFLENYLNQTVVGFVLSQLSRLFVYYNERKEEGTVMQDAGASLRDGIKSVAKWGICKEELDPYSQSDLFAEPSAEAYADAKNRRITVYRNIQQDINDLKAVLISGFPFVCGISVYESFESAGVANSGLIPMPNETVEQMLGGHAVSIFGFDDNKIIGSYTGAFLLRNSWGTSWGLNGYAWIPYDYLTDPDLANDFWMVSNEKVAG